MAVRCECLIMFAHIILASASTASSKSMAPISCHAKGVELTGATQSVLFGVGSLPLQIPNPLEFIEQI